jgi:hypothetical protein
MWKLSFNLLGWMQQSQVTRLQFKTMHLFFFLFGFNNTSNCFSQQRIKFCLKNQRVKHLISNQPHATNSPYMCIVFYFHSTSMVVILLHYHDDNMVAAKLWLILAWFLVFGWLDLMTFLELGLASWLCRIHHGQLNPQQVVRWGTQLGGKVIGLMFITLTFINM